MKDNQVGQQSTDGQQLSSETVLKPEDNPVEHPETAVEFEAHLVEQSSPETAVGSVDYLSNASLSVPTACINLVVGAFVTAAYCGKWYPGKIVRLSHDELSIDFMEIKGLNKFSWPSHKDIFSVPIIDVLCCVGEPCECKRFHVLSKFDFDKSVAAFDKWCETSAE